MHCFHVYMIFRTTSSYDSRPPHIITIAFHYSNISGSLKIALFPFDASSAMSG